MEMTDNAAGNQAGDLNAGNHRAFIRLDDDGVAFVFHAGLIEVGIQEFAGFVINSLNSTPDRAAVGGMLNTFMKVEIRISSLPV